MTTIPNSVVKYSKKLVFLHIPKTSGTTFVEYLKQINGCWVIISLAAMHSSYIKTNHFVSMANGSVNSDINDSFKYILSGHICYNQVKNAYNDNEIITWLRDPIDRLLSHYYYWKREPDLHNPGCRLLIENNLSIVEFAKLQFNSNIYSKFLMDAPLEKLGFIGIVEHMEESIRLFESYIGQKLIFVKAMRKNNAFSGSQYRIEPALREELSSILESEYIIYNQALEIFNKAAGRLV